jgi:hypothetical protein
MFTLNFLLQKEISYAFNREFEADPYIISWHKERKLTLSDLAWKIVPPPLFAICSLNVNAPLRRTFHPCSPPPPPTRRLIAASDLSRGRMAA